MAEKQQEKLLVVGLCKVSCVSAFLNAPEESADSKIAGKRAPLPTVSCHQHL